MHPTFLIIPYRKCELLQSEMIKPKSSSVWQNSTSRTTYPSKFKSRTSREVPSSSFFLVPKGIPSTRIATKPRRLPISSMANWGDAGEQLYCECRKLQSVSAEDSRGQLGEWFSDSCWCWAPCISSTPSQYSSCLFISARSSHSPLQTLPLESQGISALLPASFCFSPYSLVHSILEWEKPHPFHIILCRQIQHLLECRSHRTSEGFFPGAKGPEEQGIWQSVTISFQTLAAYLSSWTM